MTTTIIIFVAICLLGIMYYTITSAPEVQDEPKDVYPVRKVTYVAATPKEEEEVTEQPKKRRYKKRNKKKKPTVANDAQVDKRPVGRPKKSE
jgi:hypothetical protein